MVVASGSALGGEEVVGFKGWLGSWKEKLESFF
jgi:hypothetical protein